LWAGPAPCQLQPAVPHHRGAAVSSSEPPPLINGAHRRSSPTRAVIRDCGGGRPHHPFARRRLLQVIAGVSATTALAPITRCDGGDVFASPTGRERDFLFFALIN